MSRNELFKELNQILKSRNFSLLHFNITHNKEKTKHKANLNVGKFNTTSDWFSEVADAETQCISKMLYFLQNQPDQPFQSIDKRPICKIETLLFFSVLSNLFLFMTFIPITKYILYPLIALIFGLLTIPFYLNQHCDVLKCKDLTQPNSQISFLAIASKNFVLNLLNGYDITNDDPHYNIVPGCGFRVNVKNNNFSTIVKLTCKNGKLLIYHNDNIGGQSSFHDKNFSVLKVRSKYGNHYLAEKYVDRLDAGFIKRYTIITSIYFKWLFSFFYF
ncbi:hypothetical protein ACTFIR_009906 [Dictyostelium discoideum]